MSGQLELFPQEPIDLEELFEAYQACRKNKRKTSAAIAFEVNYEENLLRLYSEICEGRYVPRPSLAFIVNKPVKREIFAADFRDRIVHHLIIRKIHQLLEQKFIYDSYACRIGKGTHFAIKRVDRFIRRCTQNYTSDAWILKLDIKGFFMSIHRGLLFQRLSSFLRRTYMNNDLDLLVELCRKTIYCSPAADCRIRGKHSDWIGLPQDKSLFHSAPGCGLPIGNLTSQVFANFYLDPLDHFIKHDLGINNYGHGVKFLGAVIKPHRIYAGERTTGNFFRKIEAYNSLPLQHKPSRRERTEFLSSMNSYFGLMRNYRSYTLRKKAWSFISPYWGRLFSPVPGYEYLRHAPFPWR